MAFTGEHIDTRLRRRSTWLMLGVVLALLGAATFGWLPRTQAAAQAAEPVPPPQRPYDPIEVEPEPTGDGEVSAQALAISDPTFSLHPKIAVDSANNLHMVWQNTQEPGAPGGISFRYSKGTFNGSGYTWSTPVDVYKPGGIFNYIYPKIAVDQQDRVHVVWTWGNTIYYKSWLASQTPAQGSAPLALGAGVYPAIATGPDNRVHVTWQSEVERGNFEILYREFTGAGFTTAINLSKSGGNSLETDITVDSNNVPNAVWREGNKVTYTRRVNGVWQTPLTVSEAFSYWPSIDADGQGCVSMGWSTLGNLNQAVYRKACNGAFVYTREVGGTTNPRASVGMTKNGNALIAWETKINGVDNLNYVLIRSNGQATAVQRLEPSGAGQFWPDVIGLRNCQLAVAWQQSVGNQFDPSLRLLDPNTIASAQTVEPQQSNKPYLYYFPFLQVDHPPAC